MSGSLLYLSLEAASTPVDGKVLVDHYWTYHPSKGIAFYYTPFDARSLSGEPAPQCNRDERIARRITERLYPDHKVRHVPVVFLAHARRAMRKEPS